MLHTRVLGARIPTNAYLSFKDALFRPSPSLHAFVLLLEVYRFRECLGLRFQRILTFFSVIISRAFRDSAHSRFRCKDFNQCLPKV